MKKNRTRQEIIELIRAKHRQRIRNNKIDQLLNEKGVRKI
jgi:hypothetical protein